MDNNTLKSLIIYLRNSNKTYKEISDILNNEYNVKMTRQAVHSLYSRAVKNNSVKNLEEMNILNYYVLGYNNKEIKELLNNTEIKISDIDKIIEENKIILDDIKEEKVSDVFTAFINKESLADKRDILGYNSVEIKDKKLDNIVEDASNKYIKYNILNSILDIKNSIGNSKIIKKLKDKYIDD